ncbi:HNH endonuclease signature motif containing protein [Prescottella defluvii]|uniref:HNH endonuclease signature motif containing protein n=1 Tax=Prescottella defluvii TaxID=1323361 RepID=UPI0009DE9A29|nr:HNH endonuclease signature motif containing protein [Prescottella defluvii]
MFDSGVLMETADADVAAVLVARHARIAREQFGEIDAVTTLFVTRCEEDARLGRNEAHHGEFAHVEVAGILGLTETAARRMIGLGCDLRWRLHQVRAQFQAGRIDLAKAHALSEALANVSDDKLEEIERCLLDGADRSSTTRLKERARRLIARLDPDGARERRRRATEDRDVRVIAGEDAMSQLDGLLPAEDGRILATRLRAMTFDACGRDPRTQAQRRADALVTLASGHTHLECRCGRTDCTARVDTTAKRGSGVQIQVLVGVDAATLLGFDDAPGYLSGYGAIDADLARELAADATWKQVLTLSAADRAMLSGSGDTGPVLGIGPALPSPAHSPQAVASRTRERLRATRYRPNTQLAEIVRTRDGVCRFPNCGVPATACDLDHTVPFDHDNPDRGGLTIESNLACLCRTHHRLKTLGYWTVRQVGAGRLEWVDPTGRATETRPEGPFSDPMSPSSLRAGGDPRLAARLTDRDTLRRLNYTRAELDLDFLLESHIPLQQRRRRGSEQRRAGHHNSTDTTGAAAPF